MPTYEDCQKVAMNQKLVKFKAPGKATTFMQKDILYFSFSSYKGCSIELVVVETTKEDLIRQKEAEMDPEKLKAEAEAKAEFAQLVAKQIEEDESRYKK